MENPAATRAGRAIHSASLATKRMIETASRREWARTSRVSPTPVPRPPSQRPAITAPAPTAEVIAARPPTPEANTSAAKPGRSSTTGRAPMLAASISRKMARSPGCAKM